MKRHSEGYIVAHGGRLEHVIVAEAALGRRLPARAEIHHFNHERDDNRNTNLVICPNRGYHMLLHMRERALIACGDPAKRKCVYCKQWDAVENMAVRNKGQKGIEHRHRACHSKKQLELKSIRRGGVK